MSEPMVQFEVKMSPEEYVDIKSKAQWEGLTVAEYLVANALGKILRGC